MANVGDTVEVFATSLELCNEADAYTFTIDDSFTCVIKEANQDGSYSVEGYDNAGKIISLPKVYPSKPDGEGFYLI